MGGTSLFVIALTTEVEGATTSQSTSTRGAAIVKGVQNRLCTHFYPQPIHNSCRSNEDSYWETCNWTLPSSHSKGFIRVSPPSPCAWWRLQSEDPEGNEQRGELTKPHEIKEYLSIKAKRSSDVTCK